MLRSHFLTKKYCVTASFIEEHPKIALETTYLFCLNFFSLKTVLLRRKTSAEIFIERSYNLFGRKFNVREATNTSPNSKYCMITFLEVLPEKVITLWASPKKYKFMPATRLLTGCLPIMFFLYHGYYFQHQWCIFLPVARLVFSYYFRYRIWSMPEFTFFSNQKLFIPQTNTFHCVLSEDVTGS